MTASRILCLRTSFIFNLLCLLPLTRLSAQEQSLQPHHITENSHSVTPVTSIKKAELSPSVLPPGQSFRITYRWDASPMRKAFPVWVHIRDEQGKTVLQDDHLPPFPTKTTTWSGDLTYTRLITLPPDLNEGIYTIHAGLYDQETGDRQPLIADKGVGEEPDHSYRIAAFTVDSQAPSPLLDSAKPASLNLAGYTITFRDEFDEPLDVSALGPGTRWIAHTPYFGDFGDARFADPEKDFPFRVADGMLTIQARKNPKGKWESGLLCSVDTAGNGYAQQYGYFEMRARFPKGPGTWPAFWLLALRKLKDPSTIGFEVDIVEQYGRKPDQLHTVLHWWFPDQSHGSVGNQFTVEDMSGDFHTYGFLWDKDKMVWYFDGVELWRQPTPPESKTPLYLLINLALGPGWPIDQTPNPSLMLVDYVRVYAKTIP